MRVLFEDLSGLSTFGMQTDCLARNIVTWAIIDAEALQKC